MKIFVEGQICLDSGTGRVEETLSMCETEGR